MAKNIIDECKTWLPKFYNQGEWNESPVIRFNGRYAEDEVIEFMSDLFHFLMESKFISNSTILWLNSNMPSVKRAIEAYNSEVDEVDRLNLNTAQSAITYDKNKISKYFDVNVFFNILTYPEENLGQYRNTLDLLMSEYFADNKFKKELNIKVDKGYVSKELDEASWAVMIKTLKIYSKEYMRKIESFETNAFTREMAGYFNYLISNRRLNSTDKKRLEQVRMLMGIKE